MALRAGLLSQGPQASTEGEAASAAAPAAADQGAAEGVGGAKDKQQLSKELHKAVDAANSLQADMDDLAEEFHLVRIRLADCENECEAYRKELQNCEHMWAEDTARSEAAIAPAEQSERAMADRLRQEATRTEMAQEVCEVKHAAEVKELRIQEECVKQAAASEVKEHRMQ